MRCSRMTPPLGTFDQELHRRRQPLPRAQLAFELPAPFARERVEFGVAAEIRRLPLGFDPALMLEAMERGIERPLSDRERVVREELDSLRDAPPVERLPGNRLEDQQIQRALQQVGRLRHSTPRLSTTIPRTSTIRQCCQLPMAEC